MRSRLMLAAAALALGLAALPAQAQISTMLRITIRHPWVVVNKTMPPGTYSFRMSRGSEQQQMSATNVKTGDKAVFMVEQATTERPPTHSEAVFDRIGKKEFLTHVYQGGSPIGVSVQPSPEEAHLKKQGQTAVEHIDAGQQ